jgi:transposase
MWRDWDEKADLLTQERKLCGAGGGREARKEVGMGKRRTRRGESVTVGLDLGDRFSWYCAVNEAGEVVKEGRVSTTTPALERLFVSRRGSRVAIEAGAHSPWVSRLITACGHEVLVANPARFRLVYGSTTKNDRLDAERLARVARMDPTLLAPIHHRSEEAQADLALVRARQALVRSRTLLVNHARGSVKAFGATLPRCGTGAFAKKAAEYIPELLRPALEPVLLEIQHLTTLIRAYDRRMVEVARIRYPQTALLQQVAGIGPVTALAYMLILEDPHRFRKSRQVGSYVGLRPRQEASADRDPQKRITKAGDALLRTLLVQASHYILGRFGPDTDLRRRGMALASRGGKNGKKRAVVAVARKLAVLLHHLWVTGEVYEPLRNAEKQERLMATA